MSGKIMKDACPLYAIAVCVLLLTFLELIKVEHYGALKAVRLFFGGSPMGRPVLMMGFLLNVVLIQCMNVNPIRYLLKNNTYLLIRYGKREILLLKLFVNAFFLNVAYVALVFAALGLSMPLCGLDVSALACVETAELAGRGFLACLFCSLVQIVCSIKWEEQRTFMAMMAFAIVCAFVSCRNPGVFTVFPVRLAGPGLFLNIALCIMCLAAGIDVSLRLYQKKGEE